MIPVERDFLSLEEAAKIAKVPTAQLIQWTQEGLPFIKIRDGIRIEKENLYEWLIYEKAEE